MTQRKKYDTTAAARVTRRNAALKDAGGKNLLVALPPAHVDHLAFLIAAGFANNQRAAILKAIELAYSTTKGD